MILDTETTDLFGEVIQISVIDLSGEVLLSTLVRAQLPIALEAAAVHGLRDVDLAAAPPLTGISQQLLEVTRGRVLLAYNAPYDRRVLTHDLAAVGVDPAHLADRSNWACLMRARATVDGGPWTALNGPHHALGDCYATLDVLHGLAGSPRPSDPPYLASASLLATGGAPALNGSLP